MTSIFQQAESEERIAELKTLWDAALKVYIQAHDAWKLNPTPETKEIRRLAVLAADRAEKQYYRAKEG
mgnify:FL=1